MITKDIVVSAMIFSECDERMGLDGEMFYEFSEEQLNTFAEFLIDEKDLEIDRLTERFKRLDRKYKELKRHSKRLSPEMSK
jgi:hypothetical protein